MSNSASWGDIQGSILSQTDLQEALDEKAPASHLSDTNNPHSVTKTQVGLGNVSNDAQLKRSAGDINAFTLKSNLTANDVVLIEDSEDNFNKKKVPASSLGGGSSDNKVKISSNDSTADFLYNKLTVSCGIKKQENNDGSNESLDLSLDIHGTQQETSLAGNDEVLLYDISAGANRRASLNDLFLRLWVDLEGTQINANSFSFTGTTAERKAIEGSLFTCTNSNGTVRRVGYIKSTSGDAGTITATVVTLSNLASGDMDFKVAPNRKFWDYVHSISIPGELVADSLNSQGTWLLDIPYLAWLLSVDIKVRQAASGSSADCAINIYRNNYSLFSNSISLGTLDAKRDQIPNLGAYIGSINQYDNLSMRVTASAGGTAKPADLQCKAYIVPQTIFEAE
ncbi:MAG: hypothetical protein ABSG15_00485 [FCB group bacterium]